MMTHLSLDFSMSMTDPLIGKKLGDYAIESILGTGGMARVYRGYDDNLDRYAAIKVIEPQLIASTEEEEYRERFLREARAIARLNHSNIVSIYQFNQIGSVYYIAMEYAKGENLRDILKGYIQQGRIMPTDELLTILADIASALDYAHGQGIIHRDIKPSNIIITESHGAVLTDFGLALNATEGTIGNTFGSVHYIAPEQAISSAQAVAQSDQYSLAIVAYELLTGRVPFDDASAMSVALKHISDPPPPPTELNPNIPPEVEQVLMRALEKEPERRFETAKEFIHAMELAFKMLDNADIDAPKALTEAVGAPPETMAFPPENTEDDPEIPEASRPDNILETDSAGRRGIFVFLALALIVILAGSYFYFTGVTTRNEQSTQTAVAIIAQENSTATARALSSATAIALETRQAEDANATATRSEQLTEIASTNAAIQDLTATVAQQALESATARAIEDVNSTATAFSFQTQAAISVMQTESANETQTTIAELATDTPTATSTPLPTNTPTATTTPTNTTTPTLTATPTATATNTPVPTSTPTPGFFIEDETDTRQILLRYDGRSLIISNRDMEQTFDFGELRFILFEPDEEGNIQQTEIFLLSNSGLAEDSQNMIPERCLQLLDIEQFNSLPAPNTLADGLCTARPFWIATGSAFWLSNSSEAYFEVRLNTVDIIGRCQPQRRVTRQEKRCALDINRLQ